MVVRVSTPDSEDPPLHTLPVYVAVESMRNVGHLVVMQFGGNVFGSDPMHLSVVRPLEFTTTVALFGDMFGMVGNSQEPDALGRSARIEMYNMTWEKRRGHGHLDLDHNGLLQPCKWSLPLVPIPNKHAKASPGGSSSSAAGPAGSASTAASSAPAAAHAKASPGGSTGSAAGAAGSASIAASSAPAAPSFPVDANGFFDVNALLEDVLGLAEGAAGSGSASGAASAPTDLAAATASFPVDANASTALDQRIDAMLDDGDVDDSLEKALEDIITAGETARQMEADNKAVRAVMKQKAGTGECKSNSLTK